MNPAQSSLMGPWKCVVSTVSAEPRPLPLFRCFWFSQGVSGRFVGAFELTGEVESG